MYEDRIIHCLDCGKDILFTVKQQEFFKKKGFTPPKRCLPCRLVYRQLLRKHPELCTDGPVTTWDYFCADCGAYVKLPFELSKGKKAFCRRCIETKMKKDKQKLESQTLVIEPSPSNSTQLATSDNAQTSINDNPNEQLTSRETKDKGKAASKSKSINNNKAKPKEDAFLKKPTKSSGWVQIPKKSS
jgi:CxxC-x17-CxxC domain-containing protein